MGTLEGTKHKPWAWLLAAPLATLKEAGVHFDPEVRGLKAIQGDAQSGSALEVWALAACIAVPFASIDADFGGYLQRCIVWLDPLNDVSAIVLQ